MAKLTNFDIKNICYRYINENVSMQILAHDYGCSSSLISSSMHKAIVLGIVDIETEDENVSNIKIKNISSRDIKRANIKIGEYTYTIYDISKGETLSFEAYELQKDSSLETLSVDYNIINYSEDEISFSLAEADGIVKRKS